jgi:transposase-like protein
MKAKRKFSVEFRRQVVEEIQSGMKTVAQAMREYELGSSIISRWRNQYEHGKLDNEPTYRGALENKIAELERKIGQQTMEIELLKKARDASRRRLNEKLSEITARDGYVRGVKS